MNFENEKDSVLQKNEVGANHVMTIALFVSSGMFLLIWILVETGLFYMPHGVPRPAILVSLGAMLAAAFVSILYHHEKWWLKYLLMTAIISAYAILDAIFTYNTVILIVIPIVLSSRYFFPKYTILVAITTYAAFLFSTLWGAAYGLLDLNNLRLPVGTVVKLFGSSWLSDAVQDLPVNRHQMMREAFFYSYTVRFALSFIIFVVCVIVARQGRRMVYEQQDLTTRTVKVKADLALAARIQQDMLPRVFPPFPERTEFDVYASMTPAKIVGGDFYDFFLVDEDHLALVIADVSGKGIPAAMFMMSSKNIIAQNAMMGKNPAKALTDANAAICANNKENMFVTVWLGILEISAGVLSASNAGHEKTVLRRKGKPAIALLEKHGMALGSNACEEYEEYRIRLEPGDLIFQYTDGVTEATNADNELFGIKRTIDIMDSDVNASPKELLQNIQNGVHAFVQEAVQYDDLTMLAMEYKG